MWRFSFLSLAGLSRDVVWDEGQCDWGEVTNTIACLFSEIEQRYLSWLELTHFVSFLYTFFVFFSSV